MYVCVQVFKKTRVFVCLYMSIVFVRLTTVSECINLYYFYVWISLYKILYVSYIKENNGHDGSNEEPQWYLIENGFSRLIPDIQTVHLMGWNETDFQRISPDGSSAF